MISTGIHIISGKNADKVGLQMCLFESMTDPDPDPDKK
jgi:hypothetical protein